MKRPILYWVILFILGEVICKVLSISLVGLIGSVTLLLFSVLMNWRLRMKNRLLQLVGGMFFVLGVFCMYSWEQMIDICDMNTGEQVVFQGNLRKREENNGKITYIVKSNKINETIIASYLQIELQQETDLTLGSTIVGIGEVKEYMKATNPGGYDEDSFQHGKGIMLKVANVIIKKEHRPFFAWREYLYRLRKYFADVYAQLFQPTNASLATAMVLGDKANLNADIKELYQRNGIAHLIAISGLHIAMIGGLLYKILRKIIGSYPISAGVGVVFIIVYGVMTGLSSATLRAIIMLITAIGADVFGRRYDALTAVSLALFLMLVQNPYQITEVGFLLSFGAILGIALINPIWKMWFANIPKCVDGLCVSISVQSVLLPIMLYYFYEIPVYSIFLNVIVVPLMNLLLIFLLICAMVGGISIEIAMMLAKPADFIFFLYEKLCKISELLPGHTVCTGRPQMWWIVAYYMFLTLGVWLAYRRNIKGIFLTLAIFVLMFVTFFLPDKLKICMFDVGQGDSVYISTPNHRHILVDGGSSSKQRIGKYVLENGLKYYGGNVLDYVFVSHCDSDHYSGIKELLEEESIEIRHFVLPAITNPDEVYLMLENLALKRGCKIYYMKKGDKLQIDGVTFCCLNPKQQEYEDKNTGSIVLQMTYKAFDLLLTGDVEQTTEMDILNEINGEIEVLKVAHHGSATSSSELFLRKIRPKIACVSVGENNQYGHPAKDVIDRLVSYVQKIYLTKDCGAITIETDGNSYVISTYLQ